MQIYRKGLSIDAMDRWDRFDRAPAFWVEEDY